jgi:hypothetical protein
MQRQNLIIMDNLRNQKFMNQYVASRIRIGIFHVLFSLGLKKLIYIRGAYNGIWCLHLNRELDFFIIP